MTIESKVIEELQGTRAASILKAILRGLLERECLVLSPGHIEDALRAEGVTTLGTAFLDGRETAFTEISIVVGEALLAHPNEKAPLSGRTST